jgi:hypothetical protein
MELHRHVYTASHYRKGKIGIAGKYIPNYADIFSGIFYP